MTNLLQCCIQPSPGRECIIDDVPREWTGFEPALGRQHVKSRAPTLFHTHHRSLRFSRLQPTLTQSCYCLYITACTLCGHATSNYLAKYKQILSYIKHMTNLHFQRKRKNTEKRKVHQPYSNNIHKLYNSSSKQMFKNTINLNALCNLCEDHVLMVGFLNAYCKL
jgi:hypothetical protein